MKGKGFLIALVGAGVLATSAPAGATTGPVAYWPFDEGAGSAAADASGHGNNGTLQGGTTWIAGKRGGALAFDGLTGSVRVPSSTLLQPQDALTVSAWVKRTGTPGAFKYIVGKGALGCQTGSYGLYTGPDGGLMLYVTDGSGTSYTRSPDAGVGVWDGNWHFVAGSYDGSAVRLFVDGVELTPATPRTGPVTYFAQTTSTDLLLGDYSSCANLGFDGAVDEPKIWDRGLTAREVQASMQFGFKGFYAPVDNPAVVNVAKAGSSVPVKFSLTGYQGMDILAAGNPASRTVACDNSSGDPVETTDAAGASGLAYDASSDQYHYVWKTDKAWAGTCRELQVGLADGSAHTAMFRFAK